MTSVETVWQHAPHDYELPADEVHVWRARLDWPQNCIAGLLQVLSTQERERAEGFHFDADRKRAIIGRGLARLLVGHCLDRPPDELRIEYNEFGKPALSAVHHSPLQFNVSHAGDLILVALARGRELGVDVEQMRTGFAIDAVAARFFSPNECRALAAIAPESRCEAFFPVGLAKRHTSGQGVKACRCPFINSMSLSAPERSRGSSKPGMILLRQIAGRCTHSIPGTAVPLHLQLKAQV